ncbi:hypothetical protein HY571_01705 [Candidatus Micrarchaeota archaeon]|nr:hypothetical protein [Candidatus Micrarchaeota archaeon]
MNITPGNVALAAVLLAAMYFNPPDKNPLIFVILLIILMIHITTNTDY